MKFGEMRVSIGGGVERRCSMCLEWFVVHGPREGKACPDCRPPSVDEEIDCVSQMSGAYAMRLTAGFGAGR